MVTSIVRINRLSDSWVSGAIESLSGLRGEITKYRPTNAYGHKVDRPYLVTFSERPRPWHSNQTPSLSWWFSADEITILEGPQEYCDVCDYSWRSSGNGTDSTYLCPNCGN